LIKITQKINIKLTIKKFKLDLVSFERQYTLDGDKKKFMAITLNLHIIVNNIYLYNYSDKIIV